MPSRRAVALILLSWLAVTGYVAYRDVWPVLFASGPPPVAIDLADEAAQNVPTRWSIAYNGKPAGRLTTLMRYVEADDTFRFTHEYRNLRLDVAGLTMTAPEFTTAVRVTRSGDLREQSADGKIELSLGDTRLCEATAKLRGTVADGRLTTTCEATVSVAGKPVVSVNRTIDPVPVPEGQPLNPLEPVNRLAGVRPGRRWVVHETDPLREVREAVQKELGVSARDEQRGPLVGEVLAETRELRRANEAAACQVIEYRRDGELEARTWVRAADGRVLKQEAFHKGDTITLDRDD